MTLDLLLDGFVMALNVVAGLLMGALIVATPGFQTWRKRFRYKWMPWTRNRNDDDD